MNRIEEIRKEEDSMKRSFLGRLKVKTKLSLSIIVVVALLAGGGVAGVLVSYRATLIADARALMASELEKMGAEIDGEIRTYIRTARSASFAQASGLYGDVRATVDLARTHLNSNMPSLFGFTTTYEDPEVGKEGLTQEEIDRLFTEDRLASYIHWNDGVRHDTITEDRAHRLHISWYTDPRELAKKYLSDPKAYRGRDLIFITEPYTSRNVHMMSIVSPILKEGRFLGVVSNDVSLLLIERKMKALKPYASASSFMISQNHNIMISPLSGTGLIGKKVSELGAGFGDGMPRALRKKTGGTLKTERRSDGKPVFVSHRKLPVTGFTIGMIVDEAEILAPINRLLTLIGGGITLGLLLCTLMIYAIANRLIARPIDRFMALFARIGMGEFDARYDAVSQDEFGELGTNLNAMLDNTLSLIQSREERDAMQQSVMKLLDEISGLADGDMTARAEVSEGFTGAIADAFNLMADQLHGVVLQVRQAVDRVEQAAAGTNSATEVLSKDSQKQFEQVRSSIDVISDMGGAIRTIATRTAKSAERSIESANMAEEGAIAVTESNASIQKIREQVQETALTIKRLGESSLEIGGILRLINEIADRTSILALNASIQASMAGDAGKGFVVVAEEVQRLAEQSASSTKKVEVLIKTIQAEITEAGMGIDRTITQVVKGTELAEAARSRLDAIRTDSLALSEMIREIASVTENQASVSRTVSETMESVGQASEEMQNSSSLIANEMEKLHDTTRALHTSVEAFRI